MAKKKLKMQEVIDRMFKQYGLSDEDVKAIMEADDASATDEIEVEEDIANKLGQNLLTVESAKANAEVRKSITAEALNGFDTLGTQLIDEYKIPDDKLAEIKAEKSTHKRIKLLTKLIADIKAEEATASSKDSAAAAKTIKELNEQLAGLKEKHKTELDTLNGNFNKERVKSKVDDIYLGLEYALADVPKEVAIAAARGVIQRVEETEGVEYKLTDNGLELVKKDGTPYFDATTNKPVAPKDFIQRHLQTNKLLKVSTPPGKTPTPQPARRPSQSGEPTEVKVTNTSELEQELEHVRSQQTE